MCIGYNFCMLDIIFIYFDGMVEGFEVFEGVSLMQVVIGYGVDGIVVECGGLMMCVICYVIVDEVWVGCLLLFLVLEFDMLDSMVVLCELISCLFCQIFLIVELQGLVVCLFEWQV